MIKLITHALKKRFPKTFIPNGLLSYNDLCVLVELGIINVPLDKIQGSSVDVTLDRFIRPEKLGAQMEKVRIGKGQVIETIEHDLRELENQEYSLMPNEFILASTAETIKLTSWLSAEFRLKSSVGRCALNHILAVWLDPNFKGKVTLELKNDSRFKKLTINENMPIGQITFTKHSPVPHNKSYAVRGQYNGQDKVQPSKGVK